MNKKLILTIIIQQIKHFPLFFINLIITDQNQ